MDFLGNFIAGERKRYETRDYNLFVSAFSQITRYHQFLDVILERYAKAEKEYLANLKALRAKLSSEDGTINAEQQKLYDDGRDLTTILHLEIESFYLFAKVLLDKVARAIEFYFGEARSLSLASHNKFSKKFKVYAKAKGLTAPSNRFLELVNLLKTDIVDYRDEEIAHEKSPRTVKGTTCYADTTGTSQIISLKLYPKEGDKQSESKSPKQVMNHIDEYLKETINYISENRSKTNLKLIS